MKRAQVGVETLFAIGVVLFIMIMVSIVALSMSKTIIQKSEEGRVETECMRIASIITSVYDGGPETYISTSTNYNVVVLESGMIAVTSSDTMTYCVYSGQANSTNTTGNMVIRNIANTVRVDNGT